MILGHGHLHAFHRLALPDGLENGIRKTEGQQILYRLLAQVVVDPIDLRFVEIAMQKAIQRTGGAEIVSEGLLEDHPHPSAAFKQAGLGKTFDRPRNGRRRQGQIEDTVFRQITGEFHLPDVLAQSLIVFGFTSTHRLVMKIFVTPATQIRGMARDGLVQTFVRPKTKRLFAHLRLRRTEDERILFLQFAVRTKVKQGGQQLAPRQITSRP